MHQRYSFFFSSLLLLCVCHPFLGIADTQSDSSHKEFDNINLWEEEEVADITNEGKTKKIDFSNDLVQNNQNCRPDIQPYQINVRHNEWEGIGYKEGYTTLEGFLSPSFGRYIPFLDLRGHVFNNGKFAANAGIGARYVIDPSKYMVGANVYYDYRNTSHFHYNQVGAGLEAFLDRWEFRANGYLPVGHKSRVYKKTLEGIAFEGFEGHNLLITEYYKQKREFAMKGFNAEIGVHPLKIMRNYDLFVGVGPYYFNGKHDKNAWGGKVRVKAEIIKYLFVELSDSYDRVFHNRFQAQIALNLPLGGRKLHSWKKSNADNTVNTCFADNIMYWRGSQLVERQEIVVVDKKTIRKTVDPVAIDPTTGQPFYFVFVNNLNFSTGDGTIENPYQSLPLAQTGSSPGNVIYVFSGDGTTTNMNTGITLQNSQRFLGSGVSHNFATTKGAVVVPPQTTTSPNITGASALGIVALATHANEVSGFNMSSNSNTVPGIRSATLVTGNVFITRNYINVPSTSVAGTIAVDITDSPGMPTIVTIDSNQMIGSRIGTGIAAVTNVSTGLRITNNTVFNSALVYSQTAAPSIATTIVSGNEIHGNTNIATDPIAFQANTNSTYYLKILNNYVHDNVGNGIIIALDSPTQLGTVFADVDGNTLANNTVNGVNLRTSSIPASLCARLVNNVATNNGVNQYLINNVGGTLSIEPPNNNVGAITLSGTITEVPPCGCNVCP